MGGAECVGGILTNPSPPPIHPLSPTLSDVLSTSFTYQKCLSPLPCLTVSAKVTGSISMSNVSIANLTSPNVTITSVTCRSSKVGPWALATLARTGLAPRLV